MGANIFSKSRPIAGALLACVPLATATTASAWKNTNLLGANSGTEDAATPATSAKDRQIAYSSNSDLNAELLENLKKGFNKEGGLENMDGNFSSDALADILGMNNKAGKGEVPDFRKFANLIKEVASKNNVLGDVTDFESSDDKVILSATQGDAEKLELAKSFLEAKKLGIYDTDWTVDPFGGNYGGGTSSTSEEERLAGLFGSMGEETRAFEIVKFLTIKDKASGEVLGQITLTSDPQKKGNAYLEMWAKDGDKLVNALNLVFRALSKNENVNKVSVALKSGSGGGIESVLKRVSEGKSERFRRLNVVESVRFMELTKTKANGKYIFREGTLEKVNGKDSAPKDLQEREIPESEIENVRRSISLMKNLPSGLLPTTESPNKSVLNPETEEVVDSFVLKTTDYEFSE